MKGLTYVRRQLVELGFYPQAYIQNSGRIITAFIRKKEVLPHATLASVYQNSALSVQL